MKVKNDFQRKQKVDKNRKLKNNFVSLHEKYSLLAGVCTVTKKQVWIWELRICVLPQMEENTKIRRQ